MQNELLNLPTEVYIIDNASTDGTRILLQPRFPAFHFILNPENSGFAKANNQVLPVLAGEFILFLNPDTILAEDSLATCIAFFRSTPDAGALGVRMIDGSGEYLKESKRGFPSPETSFYRMSGLARLFPRSPKFAAYYMGHLDENQTQAVDVLSGAFLMARKSVLDQTGGFDERFFMYAEDIDLSYRIRQAGFQNYYLPETTIIHFKGESTKRDVRYITAFYTAMDQFMHKHFTGGLGKSIWIRSGMRLHQGLAYLRISLKKKRGTTDKRRTFIKGTMEDIAEIKPFLERMGIPISTTETDAEVILFCEGPEQPWKSVITEISKNKKRYGYAFHGSGTRAIVKSDSDREPGTGIAL